MSEEKIMTKHPLGKSGKNINRLVYEAMKQAIVDTLSQEEQTHTELMNSLKERLKNTFEGNISWYAETVKLDLEARKIIQRTTTKPEKYRLK